MNEGVYILGGKSFRSPNESNQGSKSINSNDTFLAKYLISGGSIEKWKMD